MVRDSLTSKSLPVLSFAGNLASNFQLSCLNLKLFPLASHSKNGSTLPQLYPEFLIKVIVLGWI